MRVAVLLAAVLVAATVAAQDTPDETLFLYPTSQPLDDPEAGAFVLDTAIPSGSPASTMMSIVPLLGPDRLAWYTEEPWEEDLLIDGGVQVDFSFGTDVEALGTLTVELLTVGPEGNITVLGSDEQTVTLGIAPRTETFTITPDEETLRAGDRLGLSLSLAGIEAIVNVEYNAAIAASLAMMAMPGGAAGGDGTGSGGDGSGFIDGLRRAEGVVAAGFLLAAVAMAGAGITGRTGP